jgi:hypothetical protein
MRRSIIVITVLFFLIVPVFALEPVRFNSDFPGGSLGKIVALDEPDSFRCSIPGQYNEAGRNRQTSWFFFRIENVKDRDVTIIMTDYIGEYNLRPGAVPMKASIQPVCSEDGQTWQHIETIIWDNTKKEATLRLKPKTDTLWIAHVPPYTHSRILNFVREMDSSPFVRVELFGETVHKRPLHLLTITDWNVPDTKKRHLFLMARQHAWEAPTSLMGEGAVRFLISDDPRAVEIRQQAIVSFIPTLDPDGCESGGVRFNRNGYDLNRYWSCVQLRSKEDLRRMPEISYALKTITALHARQPIDLLVSLHNQETGDCIMTAVDSEETKNLMQRFETILSEKTFFDSTQPKRSIRYTVPDKADTIEALWNRHRIPVTVLEIRVERHPKLNRHITSSDFITFGNGLIQSMFDAVTKETVQ